MYNLLSRITSGLEPLRTKFEEHVKRAGLAAVQRVLPAPGAVTEAGKAEVLVSLDVAFERPAFALSRLCDSSAVLIYDRIPRRISKRCSTLTPSTAQW